MPLPEILHYDGPDRWAHIEFDFTWEAQHYMVIDNLCNLTHLYVHGNWVPYRDTVLAEHGLEHGERIHLRWQHTLRRRDPLYPIHKLLFAPDLRSDESDTRMVYDYPYQRALSNGRIRSCNFMLPCTPSRTRVFTIQLWKSFGSDGALRVPPAVMQQTWARVIRPYTREIFRQDGATVEAEQVALREHWSQPYPEPNPSVRLFEKVTIDRWRAHLDQRAGRLSPEDAAGPMDRVKRL